ncbi:MAG: hypothetical protein NC320_04380 [Clostridium sp.]|nr:hypothetical protein [Clostridium sp.]
MSIRDLLKCTMLAGLYGFVVSLSFTASIILNTPLVPICSAVIIICLLIYNIYWLIRSYKGITVLLISVIYELTVTFISSFIFGMIFFAIFDIGLSPDP